MNTLHHINCYLKISTVFTIVLLKQIFETVFSNKTQAFKKVVMLEYPRKGLWILGLVSADLKGEVKDNLPNDMLNVFIPTTPNPTSGFLIFVPKKDPQGCLPQPLEF